MQKVLTSVERNTFENFDRFTLYSDIFWNLRDNINLRLWILSYILHAMGRGLTFWYLNYFLNFSTPVYKMWIIREPNTLELWNKLHFEEKKNGEYIPCLKYSVPVYKMWIIQEPNMLDLWNKLHFEGKKTESTYHV